jgi:hypothetical protein
MTASRLGFLMGFRPPHRPDSLDSSDLRRGFVTGFIEVVIVGRPLEHFLKLVI